MKQKCFVSLDDNKTKMDFQLDPKATFCNNAIVTKQMINVL